MNTVMHQPFATGLVRRALAGRRVPHAYLFHGPPGIGKEMFATGLAQYFLCREMNAVGGGPSLFDGTDDAGAVLPDPSAPVVGCGSCEDCRSVARRTHPDLHMVHRMLAKEHPSSEVRKRKAVGVGVDVIRHFLIDPAGLTAHCGRAKVFVVLEAERINEAAQNALLKTLEEPPPATYLILVTGSLETLLPTTLSRCQPVRFDLLPNDFVRGCLQERYSELDEERLAWYTAWGSGSLGRSIEAIEEDYHAVNSVVVDALVGGVHAETVKILTDQAGVLGKGFRGRDPEISETEAGRFGLKTVMAMATLWYRDVLHAVMGASGVPTNAGRVKAILAAAKSSTPGALISSIERVARAEYHLDRNVNTSLVVETLVNDWYCRRSA